MTTTANKALVTRYYDEVLNQRNLAALDDLLAPDFASWLPDGTRLGRAEYRDAVLASHEAFPDLVVEHWEEIDVLRLLRQLGILG
jgi:ketosteroid isomerase-like protein